MIWSGKMLYSRLNFVFVMTGKSAVTVGLLLLKTFNVITEMSKQRQDKNGDTSIARFWNQCIESMRKKGDKKNVVRWYNGHVT